LIRCEFECDELAVCSVEAFAGQVAVSTPDHTQVVLTLERAREFAEAVAAAITQATADRAEIDREAIDRKAIQA
jgi:ribosomal protein L17